MKKDLLLISVLLAIVYASVFAYIFSNLNFHFSFPELEKPYTSGLSYKLEDDRIYLANEVLQMEYIRDDRGWVLSWLGYVNGSNCIDPNRTWIDIVHGGKHYFFAPKSYSVLSKSDKQITIKFSDNLTISNVLWSIGVTIEFYAGKIYFFTLRFAGIPNRPVSNVELRCYPAIEIPDDVEFIWTDLEGDGFGVPTIFWHERRGAPKYLGICKYGDYTELLDTRIRRGNYGERFGFCVWNAKTSPSKGERASCCVRIILCNDIEYMWSLIKKWRNWNYKWISSWKLKETNFTRVRDRAFKYMLSYFKYFPDLDTPSDKGCLSLSYAGNNIYGLGFTSMYGALVIQPLLYFGVKEDKAEWIDKAIAIANMAIEVFQNHNASDPCYGAFWDAWDLDAKEGKDFYNRKWYWIVHGSVITTQVLYAYLYTGDEKYLESAELYFNFLLRFKDDVRGLPVYVDAETGKPNNYSGAYYSITLRAPPNWRSTAALGESMRLAAFLYKITGKKIFYKVAKEWADLMISKYEPCCIGGFLEDVVGMEIAAYGSVIGGMVSVYDITNEKKYLDFAIECAKYALTAQYMINYPGKKPGAGGFQCNDGGGSWAGYVGYAAPPDNTYFVLSLLQLYARTGIFDFYLASLAYMKWLINIQGSDGSWVEMYSETRFLDKDAPSPPSMPIEPGWTAGNCGYLIGAFYKKFERPPQNMTEILNFMRRIWWGEELMRNQK